MKRFGIIHPPPPNPSRSKTSSRRRRRIKVRTAKQKKKINVLLPPINYEISLSGGEKHDLVSCPWELGGRVRGGGGIPPPAANHITSLCRLCLSTYFISCKRLGWSSCFSNDASDFVRSTILHPVSLISHKIMFWRARCLIWKSSWRKIHEPQTWSASQYICAPFKREWISFKQTQRLETR